MKKELLILSVLSLVACGGGGESQSTSSGTAYITSVPTPATPAASSAQPQPVAPPVATVEPTLLGNNAEVAVATAGYAIADLRLREQAFAAVSGTDSCVGQAGFALNKTTGVVEIACADGQVLRYDTNTRIVTANPAFAKRELYTPNVVCTDSGICLFGRGIQSFPYVLPSDASLHVQEGDVITSRVALPDRQDNRAPFSIGLTDDGHAVVVTRGFDQREVGIHRFNLVTRTFVSSCRLWPLELTTAQVVGKSVFFTLRRAKVEDPDVAEVDATTCATKQTYRLPVADHTIPLANFLAIEADVLYIGGGSDMLATPQVGIWKLARASGQVLAYKPTASQPTAGAASQKRDVMYVALRGDQVLEVASADLVTVREFALESYGGTLFLAE